MLNRARQSVGMGVASPAGPSEGQRGSMRYSTRLRASIGGSTAATGASKIGTKGKTAASSGYKGMAKSLSLPEVVDRKDVRRGKDNVPPALKRMDYWQAMNNFDIFDSRKSGKLNKTQWFRLIEGICSDSQLVTKRFTDDVFDVVDLSGDGYIDKEEWLSWVFATNSNYCTNMRKRLSDMDPRRVTDFFESHDVDGSHSIDVDEFCELITKLSPESSLTHKAICELFNFIDVDGSGHLDREEFLNWTHPWRKADDRQLKKLIKADHHEEKASLFEMAPKTPVNLIFTIGHDFESTLCAIKGELRRIYSNKQVQIIVEYDENVSRCARLVAMVGRGIILWDKSTMIPFQEDPFYSVSSSRDWILKVLRERLPDLMGAANMKHVQKARMVAMGQGHR